MHRLSLLLMFAALPALAAPALTAQRAAEAEAAHAALGTTLAGLAVRPDSAGLQRAAAAIEAIEAAVDCYYHAPNLAQPEARPWALALRPVIHRMLRGERAVLQMGADDVISLRPRLYDQLAEAAEAAGQGAWAVIYRRRAVLAQSTPVRRQALASALRRARDARK